MHWSLLILIFECLVNYLTFIQKKAKCKGFFNKNFVLFLIIFQTVWTLLLNESKQLYNHYGIPMCNLISHSTGKIREWSESRHESSKTIMFSIRTSNNLILWPLLMNPLEMIWLIAKISVTYKNIKIQYCPVFCCDEMTTNKQFPTMCSEQEKRISNDVELWVMLNYFLPVYCSEWKIGEIAIV